MPAHISRQSPPLLATRGGRHAAAVAALLLLATATPAAEGAARGQPAPVPRVRWGTDTVDEIAAAVKSGLPIVLEGAPPQCAAAARRNLAPTPAAVQRQLQRARALTQRGARRHAAGDAGGGAVGLRVPRR
jgi:hypothetical protein